MAFESDPRDPRDPLNPYAAPTAPSAPPPSTGGYSIAGSPSDALINALYPGYKVANGQFQYGGAPSGVNGLGGGSITDPSLAAANVNKLWGPLSQNDYLGFWNALGITGGTPSPDTLKSYAPILGAAGFHLNPNARGQFTDFTLPNGQTIDPLYAAGDPSQSRWQWLDSTQGTRGNRGDPFSEVYQPPPNVNLGGQKGLSFIPPAPQFDFKAPSIEDAMNEPGYQFSFNEGKRALETSAAAKGLLGSSGTLRSLEDYGQQAATQNYGNVYGRKFGEAQARFNPLMQEYGILAGAGQHENDLEQQRAWERYLQRYNAYRNDQTDTFSRQYLLS